jgi:hypothetical protein
MSRKRSRATSEVFFRASPRRHPSAASRSCRPPTLPGCSFDLVAKDVDALVVLTGWPQFRELDRARIAGLARKPAPVG